MKTFREHILLGFMLSLVLLYSTPVKLLHNCSKLNHHHNELSFEQAHDECPICDLQFYPFLEIPAETIDANPSYQVELYAGYQTQTTLLYCNAYLNKGPPVVA